MDMIRFGNGTLKNNGCTMCMCMTCTVYARIYCITVFTVCFTMIFFFFQKLSEKYFEVKFAKINVDIAKFFVEKLKIRVLPNLVCFQKGLVIDR